MLGLKCLRSFLVELSQFWHAFFLFSKRELVSRTHATILGGFWLLAEPLFLLLLYTFVFGFILDIRFGTHTNQHMATFAIYLMAGIFPFNAFQTSILQSANCLLNNRELITKATFPARLLPATMVLSSVMTELLSLCIIIVVVAVTLQKISFWLLLLPILMLVRILLSLGLAWFFSIITVFFRDISLALNLLLTTLFFITPIMYPISLVPKEWQWVFQLNPFFHLIDAYRHILIEGQAPNWGFWVVGLIAMGVALLGLVFFTRTIERAKEFL